MTNTANSNRRETLRIMTEAAVMIALSTVLSLIKIFQLPWGGSITLLSMLPICLFSIRRGVKHGLTASLVFSLIQLFLGITMDGLLGWGLTVPALLACIMLDYVLAYSVLGLAGLFGKKNIGAIIAGIALSVALRMLSHTVSGAVVFNSFGQLWSLNIENPWIYSLLYNGAYMLPEMIITIVGAVVIFSVKPARKVLCEVGSTH